MTRSAESTSASTGKKMISRSCAVSRAGERTSKARSGWTLARPDHTTTDRCQSR
ncbi:hypothetical protein [Streptomyces sp. UNOB3_S3]|uniref:hypothetical protein n=1 Tax=Streptomyces sp. UNOB3_S3 TaxID=2871682 RepID=UPI001E3069A0|nr:hypothetical protein [Streptomyces sp. UNOB3_S3]MCC3773676.1 hypothetical protein [Streptomyces sp. UNOB3_S3]